MTFIAHVQKQTSGALKYEKTQELPGALWTPTRVPKAAHGPLYFLIMYNQERYE